MTRKGTLPMPDALLPKRRWLFWTILVLLVVLLPLAVLEIAMRVSGIRVADDPHLQFGPVKPFFLKETINGRQFYHVANRRVYRERKIVFPVKKDPGTFSDLLPPGLCKRELAASL